MNAILITAIVIGAPAIKKEPKPAILGSWKATDVNHLGRVPGPGAGFVWTFDDGPSMSIVDTSQTSTAFQYRVDARAKPAALLLTRPGKPDPEFRCIYRIEKDTLTVALRGDSELPKDFETGPDAIVWTFERVKK